MVMQLKLVKENCWEKTCSSYTRAMKATKELVNWNKSGTLQTKARLVKPVKHDLNSNSRSSVFTSVSPISKTEILSGKYPVKFYQYRIAEFYRIPVSGSDTSLKLLLTYK